MREPSPFKRALTGGRALIGGLLDIDRSLIRRFFAMDRHPLGALAWRLLLMLLIMRPWSFRFEQVAFGPEGLSPEILDAARGAGIDPFTPTFWPSIPAVVARILLPALTLAVFWWGVSRLRRHVVRRSGPGVWAALVPVGAYTLVQLAFTRTGMGAVGSFFDRITLG